MGSPNPARTCGCPHEHPRLCSAIPWAYSCRCHVQSRGDLRPPYIIWAPISPPALPLSTPIQKRTNSLCPLVTSPWETFCPILADKLGWCPASSKHSMGWGLQPFQGSTYTLPLSPMAPASQDFFESNFLQLVYKISRFVTYAFPNWKVYPIPGCSLLGPILLPRQ